MKKKLPSGLGLTLLTFVWLFLSAWVLLCAVPHKGLGRTPVRTSQAGQEPPISTSILNRLGRRASSLLHLNDLFPPEDELRHVKERLGAADWHRAGQRGKGIKVAVLDSGFKGYRQALGKVLPASVKVRSFRKDGELEARDSQHGILCGEVIHHLAPDAEILFANWEPEHPAQFLEAVRWARREGAQIISCSVIMPTWSDGEGGGPIHKDLQTVLGDGTKPGDALLFASAGNTAQRHWSGPFGADKAGWHLWGKGRKDNSIRPYSSDRVSVELVGPGSACYELVLRDVSHARDLGRVRTQSADGYFSGAIRFLPVKGQQYAVRLRQVNGDSSRGKDPERFHVTVLGGRLGTASKSGSICFPGDGREVVAVSAVDGKGRRFAYSSCGPNGKCPKPDLSAVVPFPSVWRREQPFAGTSAAAPQAAALAALIWGRQPKLTAKQVRRGLEKAALRSTKGHCCEAGHGTVRLPR